MAEESTPSGKQATYGDAEEDVVLRFPPKSHGTISVHLINMGRASPHILQPHGSGGAIGKAHRRHNGRDGA